MKLKCKEVYKETKQVTTDDTKFCIVGTVTMFQQDYGYGGKQDRFAVHVEWYEDEDYGTGEGIEGDAICNVDTTQAQAVRTCIEWIDVCAWRLSRTQADGVKVAPGDDEDICF